MVLQIGRGKYVPTNWQKAEIQSRLKVEVHSTVLLEPLINASDLVISHCGAGILLESLRAPHTQCVAVINDSLMHNHQMELADQLTTGGYIKQATPSNVL